MRASIDMTDAQVEALDTLAVANAPVPARQESTPRATRRQVIAFVGPGQSPGTIEPA
jgi:hypothetical protein